MELKEKTYYPATVKAAYITESSRGTLGVALTFKLEDEGEVKHVVWVNEKTLARAEETLVLLGADVDGLKTWDYLDNDLARDLFGHECDLTFVEETYQGNSRMVVRFINQRKAKPAPKPGLSKRMASLFSGEPVAAIDPEVGW